MLLVIGRCCGTEVLIPNRSFPNQFNFYLTAIQAANQERVMVPPDFGDS
jgi:hypothetical protein